MFGVQSRAPDGSLILVSSAYRSYLKPQAQMRSPESEWRVEKRKGPSTSGNWGDEPAKVTKKEWPEWCQET